MSCLFFFLFLFLFLCFSCPCFFVLLGRSLESSGSYEAVHLTFMFTRHGMILTCHVSTPTSSWPVSFDATKCLLADSHPVISFFSACIPPVRAWTRTSNNTVQANLTRKNYGLHTRPHLDGRAQAGPRSLHPSFNVPKRTGHVQVSRLVPLHRVT